MRELLTRSDLEQRRFLAAVDLNFGMQQSQVAKKYNVTRTTVSRWMRALVANGIAGVALRRATGRPSRLTLEQLAEVSQMIENLGKPTALYMAALIKQKYGVVYHEDHVYRLMAKLRKARA